MEKWFTSGLLISRMQKLKLYKESLSLNTSHSRDTYVKYRNVYNNLIRTSKKLFFEAELKKHSNNIKVTWDIIRKVIRKTKNKSSGISSIIVNNITFSDPKSIANEFNKFFTSIAEKISSEIHPTVRPPEPINIDPDMPTFNSSLNHITLNELYDTLSVLKSKKSEDLNGISMFFVKSIINYIHTPLLHVLNLSNREGYVPDELKIAKIVPIFKSGDSLSLDNYRPIALIPTISKILEKIICNRLVSFLEDNNLINLNQFGFRKKHSTIHPIIHLLNKITESSNHKRVSLAIFCDLKKAFDTVDKVILLKN